MSNINSEPVKTKRRLGCLPKLLIFICFIGGIALAAYFLVPGVSKPSNLGVKASQSAYESAVQKLGFSKDKAPAKGEAPDFKYTYGKPKEVDISFSSEEITSFINIDQPSYYAFKNVQVLVNPDNTLETSANIDVAYILNNVLDGRFSREDVQKAIPMLGLIPEKINVHGKYIFEIRDNHLSNINIENINIMGVPIPNSLVNSTEAKNFTRNTIDNYIRKINAEQNSSFDSIKAENGKFVIKGKIPSSITINPVK